MSDKASSSKDMAGLSEPKKRKQEEYDIPLSSSDFIELLHSDSFIDKTMLIEAILGWKDSVLVTAPRRFGKTLNARMLKKFLEIEFDENGNRKSKSKAREPVRDTENYKLFTNPIPKIPDRKLKISQEESIMDEHFGKYPVIYADFRCGSVTNFECVLNECREIIHKTFQQHSYLCKSKKLNKSERRMCEKWCSEDQFKSFDQADVESSLMNLSEYLMKHFEHRCFVIIDEYDSICSHSMFKVDESELDFIITFFLSIVDELVKGNEANVRSSFITRISHMCTTRLSQMNNIVSFKFLQNETFFEFYGLTVDEVEDLKMRFKLDETEYQKALQYYNGYNFNGKTIISIWTFMHYLKFGKIDNYWSNSGVVEHLEKTFKIHSVKYDLLIMLADFENTIIINKLGSFRVKQVCNLKNILTEPNINLTNNSLLFTFILEQGYFSTTEIMEELICIRIPNHEIKSEFLRRLKVFYDETCGLNYKLVQESAIYWNIINFACKTAILDDLKIIRNVSLDWSHHCPSDQLTWRHCLVRE